MASGQTLVKFGVQQNMPPTSNPATIVVRNGRLFLAFDTTTAEGAVFRGLMPQNYSDQTGITVYVTSMAQSATTGTIGWTVEIERATTDQDADSFATAQTITAATVSGTSGITTTSSVAITKGANMDSVVAGDWFYLRLIRDVANDNATGDAQLQGIEIRET
jgi:hypothetical protein